MSLQQIAEEGTISRGGETETSQTCTLSVKRQWWLLTHTFHSLTVFVCSASLGGSWSLRDVLRTSDCQ